MVDLRFHNFLILLGFYLSGFYNFLLIIGKILTQQNRKLEIHPPHNPGIINPTCPTNNENKS